ncbi:MAG: hypothetical protein GX455_03090 [Phycisphaerae bacterium]|nr:hypothetical protein [Phycisphaerae bacterium]
MKNRFQMIAILFSGLLAAGCSDPSKLVPSQPVSLRNARMQQAMEASQEVLRDMGFAIEKFDVEKGLVKTRPLSGSQFFEVWRSDNVGGYNFAEANLHSLRRTVFVNIYSEGPQLMARCDAQVQRLFMPQKQIASASQAAGLYTQGNINQQRLQTQSEQEETMTWMDLGADSALETEILRRLQKKIARLEGI